MVNFANSEDPDEMPHNAAFHQGLHCLPRQNRSSEVKYFLTFNNFLTGVTALWSLSKTHLS